MVAKEATEDTLAAIRNNKNVITGEEGKKLADSIPMERREYYEQAEIQISGRFLFFGGSISAGFIYNKDEKTGKREYGYTASLQGSLGPAFPSVGVSIRRHEEKGKPIEKFKGGYGGVSIGGGAGIIGEYEMEVNDVDYVEHSVSVSLGSPSAFAMGNLGWRFVANAKDARMQKFIKLKKEILLKTGMVFQSFNLFPHMTVRNNIVRTLKLVKKSSVGEAAKIAKEVLEVVGLADKIDNFPSELSGGQRQRVAIARALALRPDILLFDEPTSALDPELVKEVLDIIRKLKNERITMLIVSHEMNFVKEISDKVVVLENGKILEKGTSKQIFENPESHRVKEFLNTIY